MKRHLWQLLDHEGRVITSNADNPRAAKLQVRLLDGTEIAIELFVRDALNPLSSPFLQVRSTNECLAVVPVASNCIAVTKAPK